MAEIGELEILKAKNPGFNWPQRGPRRNYIEDNGEHARDARYFGRFFPRKYRLIMRTSDEEDALGRASKEKHSIITYNPVRLETYGVWVRE